MQRRILSVLVSVALAAVVGVIAFGSTNAEAAFNVFTFACTSSGDISLDVRGLGNTNICVEGTFAVDADCACVNNGGNCPADTHKQTTESTTTAGVSVEPKNGRVDTTIDFNPAVATCTALQSSCGGGQTARAIFATVDATYTLCTTTAPAGQPCTCAGQDTLATATDGACDTSGTLFAGKKNSCINLFP